MPGETAFSLDEYLAVLRELVSIDSKTLYAEGVRRAARFMEKRLGALGLATELIEVADLGPGVFACNRPKAERFDVLLSAHLDTVQPVGFAESHPFRIEGTRAYGPGVADCKCGVVAIEFLLRMLPPAVLEKLSVAVLLSPAEEVGPPVYLDFLAQYGRRADCALVLEPGRPENGATKIHKGCVWFNLYFKGFAAHAGGSFEKGRSAVNAMVRAIGGINTVASDIPGVTMNCGVVRGGSVPNTVPDRAEAHFDFRFERDEDREEVLRRVRALVDAGFGPGITTRMEIETNLGAMPFTEKSARLIALVDETSKALGQPPVLWRTSGGVSDANVFASSGAATIDGMGPCGDNCHNIDLEYLDLETVEPRIRLAAGTLRRLAELRGQSA